jgi:hypothetical protein
MAKPILIIAIPYDAILKPNLDEHLRQLEKKLSDYHMIAYKANDILELQFKVLNADSADDLDIEQLKKEINSKIIK